MKLFKYYSLDECTEPELVYDLLNVLMSDAKISYEAVDTDVIRITDTGLSIAEIKTLILKLSKHDVLEYTDIDDEDEDDEDDEDDDNGGDYY